MTRETHQPRPSGRRRIAGALAACLVMLASASALADTDLSNLADTLAELRASVEELSASVEAKKEEQRAKLRSLSGQKTDLEMQVQRQQRRIQQLRAQADRQREEVSSHDEVAGQLRPAVAASMDELRASIRRSLPFKRTERLAAVDEIADQLDRGLIGPEKASGRLWQVAEDEMRLARENGLYRQTITLDGQKMLVDVARVGMVAMYFRTSDGRVGYTRRDGDGWTYVVVSDETGARQINGLFDAFKKQIRVGYFRLPGGLPERGDQ